jgi:hypothetical protein
MLAGMIIVMSICMVDIPSTCREEHLDWSVEHVSAMSCMVGAEQAIAQWEQQHPAWRVSRWRCAARGSLPKRA